MASILTTVRPPVGSVLVRPKNLLIEHRGVFVGGLFGGDHVLENVPGEGPRLVPFHQFDGPSMRVGRVIPLAAQELYRRGWKILSSSRRYHWFRYNCDHL